MHLLRKGRNKGFQKVQSILVRWNPGQKKTMIVALNNTNGNAFKTIKVNRSISKIIVEYTTLIKCNYYINNSKKDFNNIK